jgi:hypothetical protein
LLIKRISVGIIIGPINCSAPFLVAVKTVDNLAMLAEPHALVLTLAAVFMLVIHLFRSLLG